MEDHGRDLRIFFFLFFFKIMLDVGFFFVCFKFCFAAGFVEKLLRKCLFKGTSHECSYSIHVLLFCQ